MKPTSKQNLAARMTDWSRFRVELRWAYEGEIRPRNLHLPPKIEPGYQAYFIHRGELSVETEDAVLKVGPGSWVINPQRLHRRDFAPGTEIISIRFELSRPDGSWLFDAGLPLSFRDVDYPELLIRSRELLDSVHSINPAAYSDLWKQQTDFEGFLLVRERFYGWLRCFLHIYGQVNHSLDRFNRFDERTRAALEFLDRAPLDSEMTESAIANQVGLSVSQLNRIFAQDLGKSPKQYWDQRKLSAAIVMLSGTVLPIKQIAFELGFQTQNYFARWFRSLIDLPPSEYRAQYSQDWQKLD